MFREVIYFCAELLNYWSMTFWGLKLFAKVYDIHVNENKVVENLLFALMCLPIAWNAAGNHIYMVYSIFLTHIIVLYMCILVKILKRKNRILFSLVAFYIYGMRLIDLLVVAVVTEISKVSRGVEINLIYTGTKRNVFLIILSVCYFFVYYWCKNNNMINHMKKNKMYCRLICVYSFLGNLCFSTVYNFDYREQLIDYWAFYLVCAFVLIGGFLFYIIGVKGKEKERFLNMRNDMMEANYLGLQKVYEKNRTLQHDHKNHLLAISELIKENKNKEALEYIHNYVDYASKSLFDIKSGNNIVDIIVSSKVLEAREKCINFIYEIDFLGKLPMESIDICALLANLLDNAIEACEKIDREQSWINLRILKRKEMLIIKIRNSIPQSVINKKYIFMSDKKDTQFHGWGMRSIDNVINKYGGIKSYTIENNEIELFITISV